MSRQSNRLLSLSNTKNCIVNKWLVAEGQKVWRGTVLCKFTAEVDGKEEDFRAPCVGLVQRLAFETGQLVEKSSPVVVIAEVCDHSVVVHDLCSDCGMDMRKTESTATVSMIHSIPQIKLTKEEASVVANRDKKYLLSHRKLALIVDLDQTLVHTSMNISIPPGLPDVYEFQLMDHPYVYHCRLRPHTRTFLEKVCKLYQMHVFTMGTRSYAQEVTNIIDPERKYFSRRIISRDEFLDPRSKSVSLESVFPEGTEMVAIIDDREDVWLRCPNLVHVKPYLFFADVGDINAPPPPLAGSLTTPAAPSNGAEKFRSNPGFLPQRRPSPSAEAEVSPVKHPRLEAEVAAVESVEQPPEQKRPEASSLPSSEDQSEHVEESKESKTGHHQIQQTSTSSNATEESRDDCAMNAHKEQSQRNGVDKLQEGEIASSPVLEGEEDSNSSSSTSSCSSTLNDTLTSQTADNDDSHEIMDTSNMELPTSEGREEAESKTALPLPPMDDSAFCPPNEDSDNEHKSDSEGSGSSSSSSSNSGSDSDSSSSSDEEENENENNGEREKDMSGTSDSNQVQLVSEGGNTGEPSEITSSANPDNSTVNNTALVTEARESQPLAPPENAPKQRRITDHDNFLLHLGDILERVHHTFYKTHDVSSKDKNTTSTAKPPDVKTIIPDLRCSVFRNLRIVFTGVIPNNQPVHRNREWNTARAFGAEIHAKVEPGLDSPRAWKRNRASTHVVVGKKGTEKLKKALRVPGLKFVTTKWLWACAEQWKTLPEEGFPVEGIDYSTLPKLSPVASEVIADPGTLYGRSRSLSASKPPPLNLKMRNFSVPETPSLLSPSSLVAFTPKEWDDMSKEVDDEISSGEEGEGGNSSDRPLSMDTSALHPDEEEEEEGVDQEDEAHLEQEANDNDDSEREGKDCSDSSSKGDSDSSDFSDGGSSDDNSEDELAKLI